MNPFRPTHRRRWLIAGLVVSLALNAFLIGAVATDLLRDHGKDSDTPRSLSFELRWLEGRLPPAGFDQVAAAVATLRPSAEQHIANLKALRQGLGELVAAPEPDRAAIDARLQEIRAELGTMVGEAQKSAIDALLTLPPDMRKGLATPEAPQN